MTMYDEDTTSNDDVNPPEESNNRTFLIAAGGLGLLVFLALACLVGYWFLSNNSNQQAELTAQAEATRQQATIEAGLTQVSVDQALTQKAAVTFTLPPTNTPVIAEATSTLSPTPNPATATVGAAFTQIALSNQTVIATTTALPNTGIADQFGGPGLVVLAFALVIVIFLVRRLRSAPAR